MPGLLLRFPIHLVAALGAGPFGVRRMLLLLVTAPLLLAVQLVHAFALLLDEIWFPGYRSTPVEAPLFVVGMPRSGTSQLQEILADDPRFTSTLLWQLILAPAICQRRLIARLGAVDRALASPLDRAFRGVQEMLFRFMEDVHPVRLDEPEEDYFLLFPIFACFLLVVPFPRSRRVWALARIDDWPEAERRALARAYRRMVQRHLHEAEPRERLLSKNPSFTPFVRTLLEEFPDARVIGCVRDPRQVVPSLLSSLEEGARPFGWSPEEPRYRDGLVDMLADFGDRLLALERDLPASRYHMLLLRDVRSDLLAHVTEVYHRFGWTPDPRFLEALAQRASQARTHTSRHHYALADYGLDVKTVETRFQNVMTRFGFDDQGTDPARLEGDAAGPPAPDGDVR